MVKLIKSLIKSAGRGVKNDSEFQKIINRFPRFFRFIRKRLTPDEKFGLQLTIGIFVTLFFIFIFYGIIREYIAHDTLVLADKSILNFIKIHRNSTLNQIMLFITYIGKGEVVVLGMIFVSTILILLRRWYYFIALLISVVGGEIFVWIIKHIIERPRPPIASALVQESTFSFPSGHSFVAVAFYGLLTYFIIRFIHKKYLKILSSIVAICLILTIGFSRIYLGVHWTSDVLASFASASALVSILIIATKIKNPDIKKPYIPQKIIYRLGILFFLIWIIYLYYFFTTHPFTSQPQVINTSIPISENLSENIFKNVPRYSATIFGGQIEPINIIIIGSQEKVINIFNSAKWLPLDSFNLKNLLILSKRSFLKQPYPTAPGFPSFWNSYPNDLEFNQPTAKNSARERYHIHLWLTQFLIDQSPVWFGTTHFDTYTKSVLPIHIVDSVLDDAREKLKNDLLKTNLIKSFALISAVKPVMGQNLFGSQFFTDGKAYLLFIQD